jgi:glutathione synthase/RimK-type ligase-like ATP-grasp enzyme
VILVISTAKDEHAKAVLEELELIGARSHLLDLSAFPEQLSLILRYGPGGTRQFAFQPPAHTRLDLGKCRAVWWRRPQAPHVSPQIRQTSHRYFALNECQEALGGLWHALDASWINDPGCDQVAHRKAYQLRVAQDVGLEIPETLITNSPSEVHEFLGRPERIAFKSFSATEEEWRETRILRDEEKAQLHQIQHAPVIFQEYIDAVYDLRVTIVGDEIFPAAIHSQQTEYMVDFRMDIANARIEPVTLPDDVSAKLAALMARLGLVYGAIDMRRTPGDHYVFLEINPAGQWLFIEQQTGQPIARTLARRLAEHDDA